MTMKKFDYSKHVNSSFRQTGTGRWMTVSDAVLAMFDKKVTGNTRRFDRAKSKISSAAARNNKTCGFAAVRADIPKGWICEDGSTPDRNIRHITFVLPEGVEVHDFDIPDPLDQVVGAVVQEATDEPDEEVRSIQEDFSSVATEAREIAEGLVSTLGNATGALPDNLTEHINEYSRIDEAQKRAKESLSEATRDSNEAIARQDMGALEASEAVRSTCISVIQQSTMERAHLDTLIRDVTPMVASTFSGMSKAISESAGNATRLLGLLARMRDRMETLELERIEAIESLEGAQTRIGNLEATIISLTEAIESQSVEMATQMTRAKTPESAVDILEGSAPTEGEQVLMIIGGNARPSVQNDIRERGGFRSVLWIQTTDQTPKQVRNQLGPISRGEVDTVVLLPAVLSNVIMREVKDLSNNNDVTCLVANKGMGTTGILESLKMAQAV